MVMVLTVLFCMLLCPHGAHADAVNALTGLSCEHACVDADHAGSQGCEVDILHSHTFRETKPSISFEGSLQPVLNEVRLSTRPPRSQRSFGQLSCEPLHTLAVRHLNTIILRV